MMRLLLIAATAMIAMANSAFAAYIEPPPVVPFLWTGCYVGGNGGFAWGSKTFNDASGSFILNPISGNGAASEALFGAIGGPQVGCDYQFAPNYVVGVRGDFDWTNLSDTTTASYSFTCTTGPCPGTGTTGTYSTPVSARVDWLTDILFRFGYAPVTGALIYVDGGPAWARDSYSIGPTCLALLGSSCYLPPTTYSPASDTRFGGVVGVGGELILGVFLGGNLSAFAEYDHYFFGTKAVAFTCGCGTTANVDINQDINTWRIGLNWRFGGHP